MSPHEPFQTLSEQERERMRDLLDLLSSEPGVAASAPIHNKIEALAELQMLIAVHNANGSAFIRELVTGELDQLREDLHTIYGPLQLTIQHLVDRQEAMSTQQDAMSTRQDAMGTRQDAMTARLQLVEQYQFLLAATVVALVIGVTAITVLLTTHLLAS